jgi:uridine phosphorylase
VGEGTIHLHPTAPLAERVLLPGDPGRALLLAQSVLSEPRMFNHNRGLWGYTGLAADGEPLTIQSTGMGGASAAIVIEELVVLGARSLIRVGTCGALVGDLELGSLLVAESALPADGASAALGATGPVAADPRLSRVLTEAGTPGAGGRVVSSDLFYDPVAERASAWVEAGALAVDMETATLFQLARRHELAAGCVLAVSDMVQPGSTRRRLHADEVAEAGERMGALAAEALRPTRSRS